MKNVHLVAVALVGCWGKEQGAADPYELRAVVPPVELRRSGAADGVLVPVGYHIIVFRPRCCEIYYRRRSSGLAHLSRQHIRPRQQIEIAITPLGHAATRFTSRSTSAYLIGQCWHQRI